MTDIKDNMQDAAAGKNNKGKNWSVFTVGASALDAMSL